MDRWYFKSIYFREPGGVLFEDRQDHRAWLSPSKSRVEALGAAEAAALGGAAPRGHRSRPRADLVVAEGS